MRIYPVDRLYEEVAFVAYHFHWSHDEVLNMPHWERQRWCDEISKINEKINEVSENPAAGPGPGHGPGGAPGGVPGRDDGPGGGIDIGPGSGLTEFDPDAEE